MHLPPRPRAVMGDEKVIWRPVATRSSAKPQYDSAYLRETV